MATKKQSEAIIGLKAKGIEIIDDTPTIEPVTQGDFASIADDEAFMHQPVTIYIQPTTDINAPPYANLNCNGDRAVVHRGRPTTLKRKHLEILARMKETRWVQQVPEGFIGQIGMDSLQGHSAHVYPFHVIEDKDSRGRGWLEHIMAEAA